MNVKLRCLDCGFRRDVADPMTASDLAEAHEEGRPKHSVIVDPYDEPTLGQCLPSSVTVERLESGFVPPQVIENLYGDATVAKVHALKFVIQQWETPVSELGDTDD